MGLLTILMPILTQVLGAVLPDPVKRAEVMTTLLTELGKLDQGQLAINQTEAAHRSLFVAGWRPMIGWACAFGIIYQFIFIPVVSWCVAMLGLDMVPLPGLDDNLWQLTMGMLGMGALRTVEKLKGITR